MLMDCDISIIKGGQDDETVFDNDSPRKTVKMIDEAQLTNAVYSKDIQLQYYLKKIQAASKIQEYLLEKSIPTCATSEEKAIINHDLLKLSKYISKCCTHCLKAEVVDTPLSSTRAASTSSHKGPGQPTKLPTDGSNTKMTPMLPTPARAQIPHTPPRVEKIPPAELSSPSTPSTLVANKSFDRLFMKLMSPSSRSKRDYKKGANGSPDSFNKPVTMASSVVRKLYDDDSELEAEPLNAVSNHREMVVPIENPSDQFISSIEDWSEVKQYITRSRSQTPSPAPVPPLSPPTSSTEEPRVSSLAVVSLEVERYSVEEEKVLPVTSMTGALSFAGVRDDDEWEEYEQGVDSRPPSPPPEMEEEMEEYVHPSVGPYEEVAKVKDMVKQEEKVVDLRVDLMESLDMSCKESLQLSFRDSRSGSGSGSGSGSDGSSTDSLRFSNDSPLPQPRRLASPVPQPVPSPNLVVGRPELTWSTEFGGARGSSGSSQQYQPMSTRNAPRKKSDRIPSRSGDEDHSSSCDDVQTMKSKSREVAPNKNFQSDRDIARGSGKLSNEMSYLQGLRRHSPLKKSSSRNAVCDQGKEPDVQHASPRRGLDSSRHMTHPKNSALQIPGNHLNLRNSLKLAQLGARRDH